MNTKKKVFVRKLRSVLIPFVVLAIFIAVLFQSCQSNEEENLQNVPQLKSGSLSSKTTEIYLEHEIFSRGGGKPVAVRKKIGHQGLIRFEPEGFTLHITNGDGKSNFVSAAIIKVDGQVVFNTSDFSKKTASLSKELTALTDNSELEVELRSDPGSYIDLWIEGTLKPIPLLTTTAVHRMTFNSAISGAVISSDGGTTISERGVCWSTYENPTINDAKNNNVFDLNGNSFSCQLTGLSVNTTYYIRAYATNSNGTGYGDQVVCTLWMNRPGPQATDFDGNVYNSVMIGNQIWMKENLKTTKYNDGTPIPLVTENYSWSNQNTPGYCWYNNEVTYKNPYGALYNWYTVRANQLCPTGWHVSTKNEWIILNDYLGGAGIAGGKLKEEGLSHWHSPNLGATNESGFTAVGSGIRLDYMKDYAFMGDGNIWWSIVEDQPENAWRWSVFYERIDVGDNGGIPVEGKLGCSIRCVKD